MPRYFKTDYAGAWSGHCASRESAIRAAIRHILEDGYTRCTVTDTRTGVDVARLRLSDDRKSVVIHTLTVIKKIAR